MSEKPNYEELKQKLEERANEIKKTNKQLKFEIEERKRAQKALKKRAEQFLALHDISLEITKPHELTELLEKVVERATYLLEGTGGGMYLCDSKKKEVRCVVSYQTLHDFTGTTLKYGEGAAGKVAQTGEALIIGDYAAWIDRAKVFEQNRPFKSVISSPLVWQNEIIGVIHVLDNKRKGRFGSEELKLLILFANQAVIAIHNARLMNQIKDQTKELQKRNNELNLEIAEREHTETILQAEKFKLKEYFENLPMFAYNVTFDGIIEDCNNTAVKTLEYDSKDELIGKPIIPTIYAPDSQKKAKKLFEKWKIKKKIENQELQIITKKGKIIDILLNVDTIFDHNGIPVHSISTQLDITERKRIENKLVAERSQLLSIFDSIDEIIYISDPQTYEILYVNQALRRAFQKDPVGGICYIEFQGLEAPCDFCTNAIIMKDKGKPYQWEYHNPILDQYFLITDRIIKWPDGRDVRFEIAINITEQKRSESALRESEEKFRIVVEESPLGIVLIDAKGRYLYINPKFTEIFGYQIEDIPTGKEWFKKAFPDETIRNQVISTWKKDQMNLPVGKTRPRTYNITCKDGSEKIINFMPAAMITGGRFMMCEDVTEAKILEAQLQQAMKMEAIGTLAGGIAHEFNNILGVIIGNAELAIDDIPEWNPANDCIEEIRTASLRAKDIVRQILSFARKTPSSRKPLNISTTVKESLKLMRASIPTSIDIRQEILCESEMILGNPTEISQIIMNLCSNSVHAMKDGAGILEVSLEAIVLNNRMKIGYIDLKAGKYVKFTVKDTGSGIDPKIIDRIMEPYFTTKNVDEGSGMGLAVVFGLVKKHDGAIKFKSDIGKGTTAEMWFPLASEAAELEREKYEDLPTGTERILCVDDEASLVKLVTRTLERQGYTVVGKTSSKEALKLFQTDPGQFDLLITDMAMPEIPGDRLAKDFKKIRLDIPIILCTGYSERIDADKARNLGIAALAMKPLEKIELINKVRKVLDDAKIETQG